MAYVAAAESLSGGTATLTRTVPDVVRSVAAWIEAQKTTTVVLRCAQCSVTYTKHLTSGDEMWRTRFAAAIDGWDCTEDDTDYCPDHTGELR